VLFRVGAPQVGHLFERDRFATKKELEEMKKLAADASQHFPAEFDQAMANPAAVKASFKKAAANAVSL
jgi:predicted Zn-dependent protease with MMP-like domain